MRDEDATVELKSPLVTAEDLQQKANEKAVLLALQIGCGVIRRGCAANGFTIHLIRADGKISGAVVGPCPYEELWDRAVQWLQARLPHPPSRPGPHAPATNEDPFRDCCPAVIALVARVGKKRALEMLSGDDDDDEW